jgi:hypothetical protein
MGARGVLGGMGGNTGFAGPAAAGTPQRAPFAGSPLMTQLLAKRKAKARPGSLAAAPITTAETSSNDFTAARRAGRLQTFRGGLY